MLSCVLLKQRYREKKQSFILFHFCSSIRNLQNNLFCLKFVTLVSGEVLQDNNNSIY